MNISEMPPSIESREKQIDKFIKIFSDSRFDCLDELPPNLLLPGDQNYHKYKCRTNWWHGLVNDMSLLEYRMPGINDEIKKVMAEFRVYINSIDYTKFRVKEEIDKANEYLDKIITLLANEKNEHA